MLSQVVSIKLNGMNYAMWQRLMKNYIASQQRLHHIDGTSVTPTRKVLVKHVGENGKEVEVPCNNPDYDRWYADDMAVIYSFGGDPPGKRERPGGSDGGCKSAAEEDVIQVFRLAGKVMWRRVDICQKRRRPRNAKGRSGLDAKLPKTLPGEHRHRAVRIEEYVNT